MSLAAPRLCLFSSLLSISLQNGVGMESLQPMDVLYEYVLDWSKGNKRSHVDGERTFIERFIGCTSSRRFSEARCF
jgi:hypothetical protein